MRVLHVIPAVAARYGGPSTAVVAMSRALIAAGLDVLVVATDADGPRRLPVATDTPTTWQDIPAVLFPRDFSESFKYSRRLARWLRAHVSEFNVVHIHAVLSHASIAAAAACRRAGTPYIVRPLGTLAPWSLGQKAARKRVLLAVAARRMLAGAAAIHYTSDIEKRETEALLGLRGGIVIPLGIDASALGDPIASDADRAGARYVLTMSRLHPKKNVEALIDAFLAIGRPAWSLVVAGEGDDAYVRSLQRLAAGAGDRVRFTGWVDGGAKRELLRGASLFALASQHENFGLSVLEALGAGVPVLISPFVQLADAVQRAGAGWVAGTDQASLRSVLGEAMACLDGPHPFADRARGLAETYAWPHIAVDLCTLYRQVQKPGDASPQAVSHALPV